MATLDQLPLRHRIFLRTYRWRRIDPVPFSRLSRPLSEARVAIVTTAGMIVPGQEPFDEDVRGGDWSYREIGADVDARTLVETHRSELFDHSGIAADPNLGFPIDPLRDLQKEHRIGSINHRHFSFMGSITAPGRLVGVTAPEVAAKLLEDAVDAVLLVPV